VTKELATGNLAWKVLPNLEEIVKDIDNYCVIAIDIPIGLTESGPRKCDIEARQLLGARRSSVFPSSISAVLLAKDYKEACRIREKVEKKRMSQQAWAIVYKIKEINELIANNTLLATKIFEVHPEVSFYYLVDNQPANFKKKTKEGIKERVLKLSRHYGFDFEYIRKIKAQFKAPEDDILDALVALWSAERIYAGRNKVLPEQESFDGNKVQKIYG